ncbi:MAG: trehalose-phosphatase, partial [Candidatus Levyibacteriota bacterium]
MSTGERPAAAAGPHPGADEREHRLYASHRIALFLDVDGTLLHIADAPDRVRVEDRTLDLLARARDATCGALALITGRSIADTDRLFAPLALPVAGQHGFERRDAAGVLHGRAAEWAPLVASARAKLDAWARRHPGVLIEDKGSSIAVHYRLAAEAGPLARVEVEAVARRSAGAL